ncbi:MAG: hypothetical protein IJF83_06125 [Methanobrevibacter sp.]|nr:hypothetical protein [Methanobrevibacter sp.]
MRNNITGIIILDAYYNLPEDFQNEYFSISADLLKKGVGNCKLSANVRINNVGSRIAYVAIPEYNSFQKFTLSNISIPENSGELDLRLEISSSETETIMHAKNLKLTIQ